MARFTALLCLAAAVSQTSAHFLLNYPSTIGFDDSLEADAPCGSFTPDFSTDNVTDYHVSGDVLAMTNTHPQVTWLFRATLDQTALKNNWTNLLPSIVQTGIGNYCEQDVVIPTSWAGSKGIINVVADSPDGILYQCAAVNFVTGTLSDVPTSCNNASGVAATYSADAALSSLPASSAATSTATSTASSTSSTTAAKSSSAASAIVIQPSYGGWAAGLWTATIALATVVACLM